jgi:uncharacterized damage-inducible protein DinB
MNKPNSADYSPYMAGYVNLAINSGDVLTTLAQLKDSSYNLFTNLNDEMANHAYAEGKWTIKQVVGHLIDAERTFAYRALAFSRGQAELPGFDENQYVDNATFNDRTLQNLAAELKSTRESNLYMLRALTPQQLDATGVANGNKITVLSLVYIMAGHELHHLNILNERYF